MQIFGYIYRITNKINGKMYIGKRQWKDSETIYKDKYMGSGKILKEAKQKYGIENFIKVILDFAYSNDELNKKEDEWIEMCGALTFKKDRYYNVAKGGQGGFVTAGKSDSDKKEMYKKIGESKKGKPLSKETKQKMSESRKGTQIGEKSYWYGKHKSEESKRKQSLAMKERFKNKENHPMYGKHLTEEQKKNFSDIQKKIYQERPERKMFGEKNPMYGKFGDQNPMYGNHVNKGKHCYNNGIIEVRTFECPEGFVPGHLVSNKMKKVNKGKHWFNNGIIEIQVFECPEGFKKGRLKK